MGREWKAGDRVAVYHGSMYEGAYGVVTGKCQTGEISVRPDSGDVDMIVWPQQCRRLRKRERRRVYIERDKIPDRDCWRVHEGMCGETWLEEQKRRGADVSKWVEFTESPPRKAGKKERE